MPDTRRHGGVNVLLVAEEAAGVQTLRALLQTDHRVVGVVTSQNAGMMRGATVRGVAERLGCNVWPSAAVRDPCFGAAVREARVDVLLNVHSLWRIPGAVTEAPLIGSFNLHPGTLPEYAGLNGPSWAIYNGEPRHGITVHWMTPEIDTGPIAYRQELETEEGETALTLSAKCVRAGVPLLLRLLDAAAHDPATIPRLPQDLARRRVYGREVPENGCLKWSQPAERIVRFVRACDYSPLPSPWGYPRALYDGHPCGVMKAFRTGRACALPVGTVGEITDSAALVAAADEWVAISRLAVASRAVNAADIVHTGVRLEDGR